MSKKNKNKWIKTGNFLFGKENVNGDMYVVVRDLNGMWSIRYSESYMIYHLLLHWMDNRNDDALTKFATMVYMACSYVHGADFYNDMIDLFNAELAAVRTKTDEKEDAKALELIMEQEKLEEEMRENGVI